MITNTSCQCKSGAGKNRIFPAKMRSRGLGVVIGKRAGRAAGGGSADAAERFGRRRAERVGLEDLGAHEAVKSEAAEKVTAVENRGKGRILRRVLVAFALVVAVCASALWWYASDYYHADATALERDFGFTPKITLREGLRKFAEWYKSYYF